MAATRPSDSISVRRRWHHLDPSHHAPILMLADVTVVDELAELRERDAQHDRRRLAMAAAPLRNGADAVLVVVDLIRDGVIRRGDAEREIILHDAAVGAGHGEA